MTAAVLAFSKRDNLVLKSTLREAKDWLAEQASHMKVGMDEAGHGQPPPSARPRF